VELSETEIATALSYAVWDAREDEPLYKELLNRNVITFFLGFEKGKPAVYLRRFYTWPKQKQTKPPIIGIDPIDCGPDCALQSMPFIITTRSRAMADFLADKRDSLSKEEPLRIVRDLIALDIEANKDRSGPPVDIMRIDAKGPIWIDKKPGCP